MTGSALVPQKCGTFKTMYQRTPEVSWRAGGLAIGVSCSHSARHAERDGYVAISLREMSGFRAWLGLNQLVVQPGIMSSVLKDVRGQHQG